jgi:hypothetical protein
LNGWNFILVEGVASALCHLVVLLSLSLAVSVCVFLSAFAFFKGKIFHFGIYKTRCGAIEVLIFLSEILPHHSRRFYAKWSFFLLRFL